MMYRKYPLRKRISARWRTLATQPDASAHSPPALAGEHNNQGVRKRD